MTEEEYKKQAKENGAEIEEEENLGEDGKEKAHEEDEAKKKSEEGEEEDDKDLDDEDKDLKKDSKKAPSIYDAYKSKKKESKEKDVKISTLETELGEMKTKFEALEKAGTKEEKEDAMDELEEFAKSIKADPETLKKMRDLFLKGHKPDEALSESLKKDLVEFQKFRSEHEKEIAQINFNKEFDQNSKFLEELFPKATKEELVAIKDKLDKLVHTKGEWNNKPLDFVIFKNKGELSKLVSPKKKGLEGRERKEEDDGFDDEFDPNADLSELSPAERAIWEKKYNALMKKDHGLSKGADGKKMLI